MNYSNHGDTGISHTVGRNDSCSGVILAGGLNRRFSGTEKAHLQVGGTRIIDRVYAIFKSLFEEIILVTNHPLHYLEWDVNIVTDIFPVRSALTGIHTGLFYCTGSHAFFAPCDTPFLRKDLVEYLVSCIDPAFDVVLPETSAGVEPLCAVYSRKMRITLEKQLMRRNLKIQNAFEKHRILRVAESDLRIRDPALLSFFNVNTPSDLAAARQIDAQER